MNAVLFTLILAACAPPPDSGDTGPPAAGAACEEGVLQCPLGQGCHDQVCGACADPTECHDLEGCRDGICGACVGPGDCRAGEACREGFCLPEAPPVWDLAIDPADLAQMEASPQEDIYVPCALTAFGTTWDDGVLCRLYGGSSRGYPKRSFLVEFPEDAENPGYSRKIALRAEYNDASYLRTFLGYEAFRHLTDLPTPRVRYVDLAINGARYGLMTDVERIRGSFLELRGRDRDASLYEAAEVDDEGALTPNATEAEYRAVYEKQCGDEDDFSDLVAFVEDTLALDWVASAADEDAALGHTAAAVHLAGYRRYLAVMAAVQNHDHVTNNFMLSWQAVGDQGPAWEVYPLDLDLTFGCLWDDTAQDTICDSYRADGWWLNGLFPDGTALGVDPVWANLLIHLVFTQPESRAAYEAELCDVLASEFWNQDLTALARAVRETIEPVVERDQRDRNADLAAFAAAWEEVVGFPAQRRAYLSEQLGCP